MKLRRSLGLSLIVLTLVSTSVFSQDDVSGLLAEGIQRWREGNSDAAVSLFERALAEDPTNDKVMEALDRAAVLEVLRMVRSDDPRIAGIGRQLLELRRREVHTRISDPASIDEAIRETLNASGQRLLELKIKNAGLYGRNLVPGLIDVLAESEIEKRALAQTWIAQIGIDSIPVLVAASHHSNPLVRTAIARVLGARSLRHPFSVATLVGLHANDSDSSVRDAAKKSYEAILADNRGVSKSGEAKLYHYGNARFLYLNPHRNPFNPIYYEPTVYHLQDDQVIAERVLSFQVNDRLAEQALVEALRLDPAFQEARELFTVNDAVQYVEFVAAAGSYEDGMSEREVLAGQEAIMRDYRHPRLLGAEKGVLFGALGLALADKNHAAAEVLLDVVRRTQRRGAVPRSMLAALMDSTSRSVRIRAAIALGDWNPSDLSPAARSAVVDALSSAVLSSGIRVAHKIMGNRDNANRFDALLRSSNVESFSTSTDVESGLVRSSQVPPDVILIDDEIRSSVASSSITPINFFVNKLRNNPRTAAVPVIVAVQSGRLADAKELYESDEKQVVVVPSDIGAAALKDEVLASLFSESDDAKARALELGILAADVLRSLSAGSAFPVQEAAGSLAQATLSRPDAIRVRCLAALGNLRGGASGSVGAIAQLFAEEDNAVEVREAAMLAVGKILDASAESATSSVLSVILEGMKSSELRLREASYFAYSAAKASGSSVFEEIYEIPHAGAEEAVGTARGFDADSAIAGQ